MIKASIDIGTNTILLLIANVSGNKVEIIEDFHKIARLGEGLDKNGFISYEAISRAVKILEFYKEQLDSNKVTQIKCVATSAMRDANNSSDVKSIFEKILDCDVEIIDGEAEARFSFLGSIEDDELNTVIDIGGGSTEIITGKKDKIDNIISLQTGAVRLSEHNNLFFPFSDSSLKSAGEELTIIYQKVKSFNFGKVIAVAGTPNTLAQINLGLTSYDREILHNYVMRTNELDEVINKIKTHTKQDLMDKYGVHPNRADIILGGALVLRKLLEISNKDEFIVSSNGLRFGVIKS